MKNVKLIQLLVGFFIILAIYAGFRYYNAVQNEIKEKERIESIEIAKQKVTKYLYDKYQKNFYVVFSSDGFKSNEYWVDDYFECGHDKNIKEYVFVVYSSDKPPLKFYVTVWKDIRTDEYEVKEVNGEKKNRKDTGYEASQKLEETKNEIKEKLEPILSENYGSYEVNYSFDRDKIKVDLKENNYTDEQDNNFENVEKIAELLKYKEIAIVMKYADFTKTYDQNTTIDNERSLCKAISDLKKYLKENYYFDYYEMRYNYGIEIDYPFALKERYNGEDKELFTKMYEDLCKKAVEYDRSIKLNFTDGSININVKEENNKESLEDYVKSWD